MKVEYGDGRIHFVGIVQGGPLTIEVAIATSQIVVIGVVGGFLTGIYDVRHREEKAQLQESSGRLQTVLDAAPVAIIVLGPEGTVERWNPAAEEIFGWSAEEVRGGPLPIIPDDREEELGERLARLQAGEAIEREEATRVRKDGSRLNLRIWAASLFDDEGTLTGTVAIVIDISNPTLSVVERTTAVAITATLLYIVLFELLFKTYRFSWGTLFYIKAANLQQQFDVSFDGSEALLEAIREGEFGSDRLKGTVQLLVVALLMVVWGQAAYYLLHNSIPDRSDEYFDKLRAFVENNRDQGKVGTRVGVLFAFSIAAVVVLPVFGIIAWIPSLAFASFGMMILVLVIMRLARHIVGFTCIAFGALRYDQFITTNKRAVALTGLYTCAVYLLLFYPP